MRADDYIPAECTLFPYRKERGRCHHCGTMLTKRQTRWCSKACSQVFEINHYWQFARRAALKRDRYRCVKCGVEPLRSTRMTVVEKEIWLEVNHIVPREGQGYNAGCHHHLAGLETLCHPCHVGVTNEQRRNRCQT